MRVIRIDPATAAVAQIELPATFGALRNAIGGSVEVAAELANGDLLLVDEAGLMRHAAYFDVGAHQTFAGPGLIVGGLAPIGPARTTLQQAQALARFGVARPSTSVEVRTFEDADSFLDFLEASRPRPVPLPDGGEDEDPDAIELLPSIEDVTDEDLVGLPDADSEDGGIFPHLDLFPGTGTAEVVLVPVTWRTLIADDVIRWHITSGTRASDLRGALRHGGDLLAKLRAVRACVLSDQGTLKACHDVGMALDRLAPR